MTVWMTPLSGFLPKAPEYQWDWDGIFSDRTLKPLFQTMKQTKQDPVWHREGNVLEHTIRVCEALSGIPDYQRLGEKEQEILAVAALLHDVGKIHCTRQEEGHIVSPHHAGTGARMTRALFWREWGLSGSVEAQQFRECVCSLIQWHTRPENIMKSESPEWELIQLADAGRLISRFSLHLLCILAEADVLGRICEDADAYMDEIRLFRMQAQESSCIFRPYVFVSETARYAYLKGRRIWKDQPLFDESWGEVVMMSGLPGTGKDTWIGKNCGNMPVISMDAFREQNGKKDMPDEGRVAQLAREAAREYLRVHTPFVWNATCLTRRRDSIVRLFESYGARVKIVFLETGWAEGLTRNASRERQVSEKVISGMLDRMEIPLGNEARNVEWHCV